MSMSKRTPTDVARAIILRITEGLPTADAKECAYAQHDGLCMRYALMSPHYEEMRTHFTSAQWNFLPTLCDAWLEVSIELYGAYSPAQ